MKLLGVLLAVQVFSSKVACIEDTCPVWMGTDCLCPRCMRCDQKRLVYKEDKVCISFQNSTQAIYTGLCPYAYDQETFSRELTPQISHSEFMEIMCGTLNREGTLCHKCKTGYGIPALTKTNDYCVKCTSKLNWLLYAALELLPLTLFYAAVIIFNFSATRPPLTAYIFFCQLFPQLFNNLFYIKNLFLTNVHHTYLRFTWTVTGLWNFDLLGYVMHGFCLNEHFNRNIHKIALELISAVYPLLLIIITLILINMHDRNCKCVVLLWKPFHKCFSHFRRSWDPRSSVMNAFATFLLLSAIKICFVVFNICGIMNLYKSFNGTCTSEERLYIDPMVKYENLYKQPYFVPTLALLVIFVVFPSFFLAVYPTRWFKRVIHILLQSGRQRNTLFLLMDGFQGFYKDGTTGTYDYRSASCLVFLVRLIVCAILSGPWSRVASARNGPVFALAGSFVAVSLFYALVQPYKERYMNTIESLLYSLSAVLLIAIMHNNHYPYLFDIILALILLPSVVFLAAILYRALQVLGVVQKMKRLMKRNSETEVIESINKEAHRLSNPTDYSPLLHQASKKRYNN